MRHAAFAATGFLALAIAGCSSGRTGGDRTVGSFLEGLPAGRNFTGQGDMGVGVMGNSEGESGPSQVAVPDWGHGRDAIK